MNNQKNSQAPTVTYGYKIPEHRKIPGTGDYTGRCWRCGSSNLWDDNLSYGCNDCGMMRIGS